MSDQLSMFLSEKLPLQKSDTSKRKKKEWIISECSKWQCTLEMWNCWQITAQVSIQGLQIWIFRVRTFIFLAWDKMKCVPILRSTIRRFLWKETAPTLNCDSKKLWKELNVLKVLILNGMKPLNFSTISNINKWQ